MNEEINSYIRDYIKALEKLNEQALKREIKYRDYKQRFDADMRKCASLVFLAALGMDDSNDSLSFIDNETIVDFFNANSATINTIARDLYCGMYDYDKELLLSDLSCCVVNVVTLAIATQRKYYNSRQYTCADGEERCWVSNTCGRCTLPKGHQGKHLSPNDIEFD